MADGVTGDGNPSLFGGDPGVSACPGVHCWPTECRPRGGGEQALVWGCGFQGLRGLENAA